MNDHPVILFDGVCNLCNASVRFVVKRDPSGVFRFAPLDSEPALRLLEAAGVPREDLPDSIVLSMDGRVLTLSTAALEIARRLRSPWKLLYGLIILPAFLRDPVYRWIARNRYRWFGRQDTCAVAVEPGIRERFLA